MAKLKPTKHTAARQVTTDFNFMIVLLKSLNWKNSLCPHAACSECELVVIAAHPHKPRFTPVFPPAVLEQPVFFAHFLGAILAKTDYSHGVVGCLDLSAATLSFEICYDTS